MTPGLAPLYMPWWAPVDVIVDAAPSLQEQLCFYGWCRAGDDHAEGCDTYTPIQVAAAQLHGKLAQRREER